MAEIQAKLTSITEDLTELSVDLLRSALEAGETKRPPLDKKLSQARRAVERAARLLEPERSDPD